MKLGDKFTIEGLGYSAKGHMVVHGRSTKTNRKMKVAKPLVYEFKRVISGPCDPMLWPFPEHKQVSKD